MIPVLQTSTVTGGADSLAAVHLLLPAGHVELRVEDPEQVMEEIQLRATQVSSVLEEILSDSHGRPDWGLNE